MAFFTRILNFRKTLLARLREQRKQDRCRVGAEFPLLASLSLAGHESVSARSAATGAPACNWNGRVGELSSGGLSVRLPPAAITARNEATTVRLTLDGRDLDIRCTVAHFRVYSTHALCGLRLEFDDFTVQKAYHQIVEAVNLGASFAPVDGSRAPHPAQGLVRRQWRSLKRARLTEWREAATSRLNGVEFILEEHSIEGRVGIPGLKITSRSGRGKAATPAVEAELRQLFLWVVANMPGTVPADLKEFIRRGPPAAPATPVAWNQPPKQSSPSPAQWLPPKNPARSPG